MLTARMTRMSGPWSQMTTFVKSVRNQELWGPVTLLVSIEKVTGSFVPKAAQIVMAPKEPFLS
jgi:hypothetical protein